jgi:hypothetical protein
MGLAIKQAITDAPVKQSIEPHVHTAMKGILQYLLDHPKSQDRAIGISQWWLRGFECPHREEVVVRALERLTALGLLIARFGPNGGISYQFNDTCTLEAEAFLRSLPSWGAKQR